VKRSLLATVCIAPLAAAPVWLAGASYTFMAANGLLGIPGQWDRATAWWTYAHSDYASIPSVKITLALSALLAAAPFAAITALVWRRGPGRKLRRSPYGSRRPIEPGVTDNHGHAEFATPADLRQLGGPGCLIGAMDRSAKPQLIYGPEDGHSLIFGAPGSGKSTTAVTRLMHWNGPRVVFDPSCELGPIMTPALTAAGFKVHSVGFGKAGFNALDWIDVTHPEHDAHIRVLVDHIYDADAAGRSRGGQSDPFWDKQGRALIACLLAHLLHDPRVPHTLAALRVGIATPEAQLPTLLAGIHQSSGSMMARDLAGGLMHMAAPETFSGIAANARSGTDWLSVQPYVDLVSGSDFKSSDITDSLTVLFIQLPLRSLLASRALGRAVMAALFNALFHAEGRIERPVLFQIDEAAVLGPLKEILLCYATARKYRGVICCAYQSEAQLADVFGVDGARTIRDSVTWRSYNAVQDGDVATKLSRDLGEYAVLAYSEGDNRGTSKSSGPGAGSSSRGSTQSKHEIKRALVKADEIMRAPSDRMWVLLRNFPRPIECVTAPYYRYPEIARQMVPNPFARKSS
jgi:type IV secretion system protein VirD4